MNKRYSLKKNRDFQYVYRRGKSAACYHCVLIYCKNRTGELKVGFSASKKIGNSVKRNRAKRLMREAFRACLPNLRTDYNYILIARNGIDGASFEKVLKSMDKLFLREGIYK